jgi:hypothetical protein
LLRELQAEGLAHTGDWGGLLSSKRWYAGKQ